jgi:hypothetical protein
LLVPNEQGGYHAFEVTADVQNWANSTLPNYGWGILPWPKGSDGWGIDTSESASEASRPQLVIYYTLVNSGPAQPKLLPLTVSSTQVQVKFSGTIGTTYTVWRTASLGGTWSSIGTAMVGSDGTATFMDNAPLPTAAYYRLSNP